MENDANILRVFAVLGLVAAIATGAVLAVKSGLAGGGGSGPVLALNTTASSLTGTTVANTASTGDFSSGEPGPTVTAVDTTGSSTTVSDTTADTTTDQTGSSTTSTSTYVVQDGDTFYSIAQKYNTTVATIKELNPGVNPQQLHAGLKLAVPE